MPTNPVEGTFVKRIGYMLCALVALTSAGVYVSLAPALADGAGAPIFDVELPAGYRDWKLVSVAHEEGALNDLRAVLGNDVAIKAYREGRLPFPDGAISARLAWKYVPSEENNKAFGRPQSFVAGAATNAQFMVKDSKKYAATSGWGFAQFNDGKPIDALDLAAVIPVTCPSKIAIFSLLNMRPDRDNG